MPNPTKPSPRRAATGQSREPAGTVSTVATPGMFEGAGITDTITRRLSIPVPKVACVHNTDGRRGDAVAYQFATHDIGTIGRRLGCLASFIVAASVDYNDCTVSGVSSSSGYDVSCHGRQL